MFNSQDIQDDNETSNSNNKRITTVLSYSDKKNLMDPTPITTTTLLHNEANTEIDPTDDYHTSNQLNEIVMSKSIELHYFVFHNDIEGVKKYILKHKKLKHNLSDYLSIRDVHGNTPLHLAAMLGHIEIASLLTKYGAVVKARNKQMWTPLDEAISYGNRDLSKKYYTFYK
jgi:ankyrin repeat protein